MIPFFDRGVMQHTLANVKSGKGDPCRLVGLDLAVIKRKAQEGTLSSSDIDNGLWKLPNSGDFNDWINHQKVKQMLQGFSGFLIGPGNGFFIPVAGGRHYGDGHVSVQHSSSQYWAQDFDYYEDVPWCLYVTPSVIALSASPTQSFQGNGYPIRCISQ